VCTAVLRAADESRVGEQQVSERALWKTRNIRESFTKIIICSAQRANNFHRNIRLHDRADERHDRL